MAISVWFSNEGMPQIIHYFFLLRVILLKFLKGVLQVCKYIHTTLLCATLRVTRLLFKT
jgi:hypothetical protein